MNENCYRKAIESESKIYEKYQKISEMTVLDDGFR